MATRSFEARSAPALRVERLPMLAASCTRTYRGFTPHPYAPETFGARRELRARTEWYA